MNGIATWIDTHVAHKVSQTLCEHLKVFKSLHPLQMTRSIFFSTESANECSNIMKRKYLENIQSFSTDSAARYLYPKELKDDVFRRYNL